MLQYSQTMNKQRLRSLCVAQKTTTYSKQGGKSADRFVMIDLQSIRSLRVDTKLLNKNCCNKIGFVRDNS